LDAGAARVWTLWKRAQHTFLTRLLGDRPRKTLGVVVASLLAVGALVATHAAGAAQAAVGLGTADSFAVLAGSGVTNTGPTVVSGNLGTCPTPAVTGFPPGMVQNGTIHANDAVACGAQSDLTIAYNDAAGRAPTTTFPGPTDLGGMTLAPGVYKSPSSFAITGTVTLDAQGDPSAVFIFQAGSTLITATDSVVALINGAGACNVFWQVGSSATIGVGSTFVGSILALTDITANTNATAQGRLLARNGAVTLDSNTITRPACAAATTTTTAAPGATTTTTAAPGATTTTTAPATVTTTTIQSTTTSVTTTSTPTTTSTSTGTAPAIESTGTASATPSAVAPGQPTTISGGGFTPGASLAIRLDNAPGVLTTARADARGDFTATVPIPSSTSAGTHYVVVTGIGINGAARRLTATVQVTGSRAPFPVTGSDLRALGLAGLAAIALGALTMAVSLSPRRRRW
jgi:ice-binding like protein